MNEVNNNLIKDVHEFDGSLNVNLEKKFSKEEKLNKIKEYVKMVRNKEALSMLEIIVLDLINDTNHNYDEYNKIEATDILVNILNKDITKDILDLLEEQLSDMYYLGRCSQGRTTRLIQIWNLIK